MGTLEVWSFCIAFFVSLILTGIVREYAVRTNLIDVPNHRSSHRVSTPRGGGLSIAFVFLVGMFILLLQGAISVSVFLSIFVGGILTAGIGLIDDHVHVPAYWRSAIHFLAACITLILLGGLPAIQFGTATVDLGIVGDLLAAVFIVWVINLFNFMDGIDGLAAVEVICVAGGVLLITVVPAGGFVDAALGILLAATLGFLVWNWPPAKIFMGDVGSGFVGFVLVAIAIESCRLGETNIWSWLILAGVFVVDATTTLLVRVASRQSWYKAHNTHAYQKAARRLGSHRQVTMIVLLLNVAWLLPLAWFGTRFPHNGWWRTVLAWIPLIARAAVLRAGRVHSTPVYQRSSK